MYGRKILLPYCTQTHSHARTLTHSLTHPRTRTHTHAHTHTHPYIHHTHTPYTHTIHTHHTHTIHTPYTHHTHTIHTTYTQQTYTYTHAHTHTHTHSMHTHCVTSSIRLRQGLNVVIIAENSASCHLGANAPQICYALRTTHKISSDVVELWGRCVPFPVLPI